MKNSWNCKLERISGSSVNIFFLENVLLIVLWEISKSFSTFHGFSKLAVPTP
jgi:hypothetical protein